MAVKFKNTININDQYTFPTVVGTDGQYLSITDAAAGQLDWTDLGDVDGLKSNFVYYDAKNSTGSTIPVGTAVMAVGTDGNSGHILIAPMVADGSVEPKFFIGVTDTTIANGVIGKVVHFGTIDQVNTNAFSDGDVLWCDPANPGGFTITEPTAPAVKLAAAIVLNSSTNGKLLVRVQGNEGLHELHDVNIQSASNGQVLTWNSTNGVWENTTISSTANDATITLNAGTGLTGGGDFTTDQSTNESITLGLSNTGVSANTYGNQNNIPVITVDSQGRITDAYETFLDIPEQTSIIVGGDSVTGDITFQSTGDTTITQSGGTITIDSESPTRASTLVVEKNEYTGDGTTVDYVLSSPIQSESQTQVYIDGVYQSKSNYTSSGSTLTFSEAPDDGTDIEIIHLLSVTAVVYTDTYTADGLTSEYVLSYAITAENNTQVYFDGVYQSKTTYETSGRTITFSENVPDGVEIEIVHLKAVDMSSLNSNQFTGDGTKTDFTLAQSLDVKDKAFVFIQGVYQEKSTYSVSGTTLSFNTAPQNNYTIEVVTLTSTGSEGGGITTGTTAERPTDPTEGLTRYNTDTKKLELYNGAGWFNVGPDYTFTADATLLTVDSDKVRVDSTTF